MDQTLPKLLSRITREYSDTTAQFSKNSTGAFDPVSYREYYGIVLDFAGGLLSLGHARGDHVGIISDNRKEWLHASMAVMAIGAADVPRGCDANAREITYILSFAECKTVVLENDSQVQKILANREALPLLSTLILFETLSETRAAEVRAAGFDLYTYAEILSLGKAWRASHPATVEAELEKGESDDIATIIFTSGTTGEPKGVMLSHGNFLCQLEELPSRILIHPGEKALCVLPVWHAFERLCEYVILINAASIVYSKPIGSALLADLAKMNPQILPSVPRIWESVYDGIYRLMRKTGGVTWLMFNFFVNAAILESRMERKVLGRSPVFKKGQRTVEAVLCFIPFILLWPWKALGNVLVFGKIRAKLGTSFRGGVSGGGALPPNIDDFFWAVGVTVVEGYGLTETAPVVAVRPMVRPVFGTIGTPISCCEIKIVDDNGKELPPGEKGTVLIRGGNVMKGYYRKSELTAKVLSPDGWLDTGDLGYKTLHGEIVLRGRKKDTIVLRGGENIEPAPLEMKLNESRFISQSVLLGQDQRYLGALIVVNRDEVMAWAADNSIDQASFTELLQDEQVRKLFEGEVSDLVNARNGFKIFERINRFVLLEKPFETGVELSAKQEIMRYKLGDLYKKEIKALFE
jgi:long-chain acyl-CoA synthetase